MRNDELKELYDRAYRDGEEEFFSKFADGKDTSEANELVLSAVNWRGKRVLDVGCGAGTIAAEIAGRGASLVCGIDYAEAAIEKARRLYSRDNLEFRCMNLEEWSAPVDCVVSLGTLEHMDEPALALRAIGRLLKPGGRAVITCPCFINVRGIIWMTLQLLQDVPMSLTDLHFLSRFDIKDMATNAGLVLDRVESCDFSRGNGEQMLVDLEKRLTNALRDAGIDGSRVPRLLAWLEEVVHLVEGEGAGPLMGATGFYVMVKPEPILPAGTGEAER